MNSSSTRAKLLKLAAEGHRVPIGTHLVLHRHPDHAAIQLDGARLGQVIIEAAGHYNSPLGMPLMDLSIEKDAMLRTFGVPAHEIDIHHFTAVPPACKSFDTTAKMKASCTAIREVGRHPDLMPMGMGIGPFSLMTKLVPDPITPVFLAGTGLGPDDEQEIAIVERTIELGTDLIVAYAQAQARAGAKAIIICEPAANLVYFSPNQLNESYEIFDRYVMRPMQRIKDAIAACGSELVFHDCGELTEGMVSRFTKLDAAMISLGSSRSMWKDAALIPKTTVLYGNLPTKGFIAPQLTVAEVERKAASLAAHMRSADHPFILGSECDVLSVPGREEELMSKVMAFLRQG